MATDPSQQQQQQPSSAQQQQHVLPTFASHQLPPTPLNIPIPPQTPQQQPFLQNYGVGNLENFPVGGPFMPPTPTTMQPSIHPSPILTPSTSTVARTPSQQVLLPVLPAVPLNCVRARGTPCFQWTAMLRTPLWAFSYDYLGEFDGVVPTTGTCSLLSPSCLLLVTDIEVEWNVPLAYVTDHPYQSITGPAGVPSGRLCVVPLRALFLVYPDNTLQPLV